jgi:hypothetical protein
MPVTQYLIGNDGDATFTAGTTTQTIFKVRSYAATLGRNSVDLTAFGDTGRRKRLGMLDVTGSLNAVIGLDNTASTTTTNFFVSEQRTYNTSEAVTLSLVFGAGATTTNQAKIVAKVVMNNFAFNNDKAGDSTLSANFENADGAAPVVTWLI